ncbi:lipocalin-like domain-containing protein [Streptomyces sp. NPDC003758]
MHPPTTAQLTAPDGTGRGARPTAPDTTGRAAGPWETDEDLTGVWSLRSFHDLDDDGTVHEGPLGPAPAGLLVYAPGGRLSVTMMRTGPAQPGRPDYMSYAGTWRRDGDRVVHTIDLAPDRSWLSTDQIRDLVFVARDELELRGRALVGRPQLRVLRWRRVTH